MTPPFIISNDFITIVAANKPHTIYKNDNRFSQLLSAIKEKNWDVIEQIVSLPKAIALFTAGKVQVFEGQVVYNGKPVNSSLTERILEFVREGIPFEPLVNFMDKLMGNPSQRSIEQLYNYLNLYKLPICDDGDFIAIKAVERDTFLDKYTRSISNKVGENPKMERKSCVDNDDIACGESLHCGNYEYVKTYGTAEDEVILVKINPKDVVSCPKDASYQKLRVCEYVVIGHTGKVKDIEGFKSNYAGKEEITKEHVISPSVEIEETKVKIGANKAYQFYRQGEKIVSDSVNLDQFDIEKNLPRSFFRQYSDWYLIKE